MTVMTLDKLIEELGHDDDYLDMDTAIRFYTEKQQEAEYDD